MKNENRNMAIVHCACGKTLTVKANTNSGILLKLEASPWGVAENDVKAGGHIRGVCPECGRSNLRPAFRDPKSGQITTGRTHLHAWISAGTPSVVDYIEEVQLSTDGFVRPDGRFLTRAEALSSHGIELSEQIPQGATHV